MKKPYLIAEIGINHNGDIEIAKKLIDLAKRTGFDSVKFQKRDIDLVYSKSLLKSYRESPWGNTQRDQKEGLEFNEDQYREIDKHCKEINIEWFASAWDTKSLNFLDKFNLKYQKIASAMIVDKNFLAEVAQRKAHTFISTGMSTYQNIADAVEIFKQNNCSFELMHCVSIYPLKVKDVNLETIKGLKKEFNCNVGYSGHENGMMVSVGALMYGISSLERHITLDRTMYGSDQAASLEEKGLEMLIKGIHKILLAMGKNSIGNIHEDEVKIAKKLRAHLTSYES
jgi:N-acetylneuraminate synthase